MSKIQLPFTTLHNVKMVVFDKDGTLIDIHHYWCSMIQFRASFFLKTLVDGIDKEKVYAHLIDAMGIDANNKMKPEGPVGIKPRSFIEKRALEVLHLYDTEYTLEQVQEVFLKVDEYSKEHLHEIVQPLQGVKALLENLQKNGVMMSIATTDRTQRAMLAMQTLHLDTFFEDIVGADKVLHPKPSGDLVRYIADRHHIEMDEIVVVGDSMADLLMAQDAQCRFIGVKTGLYTKRFLQESSYLIEHLAQMEVCV